MKSTLIAALLLTARGLCAQTGTGSIQGTVRDATQAVVPNVKVAAIHTATARRFESSTNTAGFYLLPSVPGGDYQMEVDAPGMEKWKGSFLVQVGQSAVVNPVLQVGATASQVTVAGDVTPLVTTSAPTLANVVERERIEQLPLNGRTVNTLIQLTTPGLESDSQAPRINGMRDGSMEFLQDGAVLSDRNTDYFYFRPPGLDTVQEFRVETSVPSSKYSRPASAILSTRAGTNQWHGAAFYTGRNNGFGVARRRQDYYDKPPQLIRNEYGASVGGPVWLPKLYDGRNRTFFFLAWEGLRLRNASTIATSMATLPMRQGDFSGLIDGTGRRITLYDPWSTGTSPSWTRTPFPNNTLPLNRLSPLAAYMYGVTPAPTHPDRNPLVTDNYFGLSPNNQDQHTNTMRLDHRFRDRDQVFGRISTGRYQQDRRRVNNTNNTPLTADGLFNYDPAGERSASAMVSWVHTLSPRMFLETVASGSRLEYNNDVDAKGAQDNIAGQLGLPNPFNRTAAPQIGSIGFDTVYFGPVPRNSDSRTTSGEQNLTVVLGKHSLELGWRYRRDSVDVLPDRPSQSIINFNSSATSLYDPATGQAMGALPRTGYDAANFFLGVASGYSQTRPPGSYVARSREISSYVQDNWRVSNRLTLNLGLRYEYFSPWNDSTGVFSGFDLNDKTILRGISLDRLIEIGQTTRPIVDAYNAIGVRYATSSGPLVQSNKLDFSPRLGFAWSLRAGRRQMALRGGYGLYHFGLPVRILNDQRGNPPLQGTFSSSINSSAQTPDGLPNYGLRSAPAVIAGLNSKNAIDPNQASPIQRGVTAATLAQHLPTPVEHEWNLTLETEILHNTLLSVGVLGSAGRNMDQRQLINGAPNNYIWYVTTGSPLPTGTYANVARRPFDQQTYGDIRIYRHTAYTNSAGVQVQLQRRFSRGLAFQVFYVLNNTFSTGTLNSRGGGGALDNGVLGAESFLPGAVPADYDQRNRFLNYQRDTDLPKHRVRWNSLVDSPVGRGKHFLRGVPAWADRIVGGWQLAAYGSMQSRYFALPTGDWGPTGKIEVYGTKYKIEDCRSGVCIPGYLYYNGYIPANRINSHDAQGRPNGVMGVPADYKPSHQPVIATPANPAPNDPNTALFETQTVYVPLKNGNLQRVAVDTNLHPWRNQYMPAPWAIDMSASLFKVIPLKERLRLRLNMDFFNVMNNPGLPVPASASGILSLQNSSNGPRQLQWTLRLNW